MARMFVNAIQRERERESDESKVKMLVIVGARRRCCDADDDDVIARRITWASPRNVKQHTTMQKANVIEQDLKHRTASRVLHNYSNFGI